MKSENKSVKSSDNIPIGAEQFKAQEAAFIRRRNERAHSRSRFDFDDEQFMAIDSASSIRREVANKIDETKKDLEKQITQKVTDAKKDIDAKAKDTEANLDKKVLEARNKIIEPLAIFVGLFTFISIGFQVFTQVKEYILWMPILGAVLGGIIILSGLVIHASSVSADTKERRIYTGIIVAIGFFILCAAGYYYHQASQIIRVEDMKECIVAIDSEKNTETTYCKLKR